MSWSASGTGLAHNDEVQALTSTTEMDAAQEAQLSAAKEAALVVIGSGAVGEGPYNVSLSGHTSPGSVPTCYVSVSAVNAAT